MFRFQSSPAKRSSSFGFFLFFCLILSLPTFCPTAQGATYTVTNTNDSGAGSLRQAIIMANTNPGPDTIAFSIPGCGVVCTIHPLTPLTLNTLNGSNTTIDGYTQTGSAPATATTSATPMIEINGSAIMVNNNCLEISSSGNVIKGLVVNNCAANGISISGSGATGNHLSGNLIGTNYNGFSNGPNTFSGVFIGSGASGNIIGGSDVSERNLISGNNYSGVEISGPGTSDNVVSGNYIGTFPSGDFAMPNLQNGIRIHNGAQYNTIGGDTEGQRNLISGNGAQGIRIDGATTSNNTVSGNFIGTNAAGSGSVANAQYGVRLVAGAHHNTIGGAASGSRNIISGNGAGGIGLDTSNWNTISGNYIGTDPGGQTARGNFNGILLMNSSNNVIGGDGPGSGNIISGNTGYGVHLYGGGTPCTLNLIKGNYIGLAADGITPLPNPVGIRLQGSVSQNTVGGNLAGQRNVISGNSETGVLINTATHNTVSGNYIGTDASGRVAVGNGLRGVFLDSGANTNLIGGDDPATANVISGNRIGLWVEGDVALAQGNTIKGNFIGTDPSGLNALGNLDDGVYLGPRSQYNYIGPYNIIAFNASDGVAVDTPTALSAWITRNRIFANGDLGIRLSNGGNHDMPAPVIQSTTFGSIRIAVAACPLCTVQVFNSRFPDGEGEFYLGGGVADAAGAYTLVVDSLAYPFLTATATQEGGTSEFSAVFTSTAYILNLPMILR